MATSLKPIKGSISWNKSSGSVQSSGIVPPDTGMSSMNVGDEIILIFESKVEYDTGSQTVSLAVSPVLTLADWRCTPTGWVYSATNDYMPTIKGEYISIFECSYKYKSIVLNLDSEESIDSLVLYDRSNIRQTKSPYASENSGWWILSDIVTNWSIPDLANSYVVELSLTEYTNEISILRGFIPLMDQLFWLDSFTKTVSMISYFDTIDTNQDVSVSTYLDLRTVDSVDLVGGKGDPRLDPRTNGNNKLEFNVETVTDAPSSDEVVTLTRIRELMTDSPWFIFGTVSEQAQYKKIFEVLSEPKEMPPKLIQYMNDLYLQPKVSQKFVFLVEECAKANLNFYNFYITSLYSKKQRQYTFNNCSDLVAPETHTAPLIQETINISVDLDHRMNQKVAAEFGAVDGITLDALSFKHTKKYSWTEKNDNITGESTTFDEAMHEAAHISHTIYEFTPLCNGVDDEGTIPYLFKRRKKVTNNYQAGVFLLNLDSLFWNTPNAGTDLGARDPSGNSIWIGPNDRPNAYGPLAVGLYVLARQQLADDDTKKAICTFANTPYLLIESDIVVAAIADQLSLDAPQDYKESYDQYFKAIKNWSDGVFNMFNGLQYSYQRAHQGLNKALGMMMEKHGKDKMKDIYERILPGTRIEDAKDGAGGSYCKDMLSWIAEHGFCRFAGIGGKPIDNSIPISPLLISTSEVLFNSNSVVTKNTNHLTKEVEILDVPTPGSPDMVYVSPRYEQLSTIERGTTGSVRIMPTKIMDWDTLSILKEEYNKLCGHRLVTASYSTDYTDSPKGVRNELSDNLSNVSIRSTKLSVSGEGSIMVDKTQIAIMD